MKVVLACMWTVIWFLGCSFFISFFFTQVSSMKQDSKKADEQEKWDAEEEKERELVKTKAAKTKVFLQRERNWVGKLTSEWIGLAAGWIPEAHLSGQSLGPSVTGIPSEPSRESQQWGEGTQRQIQLSKSFKKVAISFALRRTSPAKAYCDGNHTDHIFPPTEMNGRRKENQEDVFGVFAGTEQVLV